MSLEGIAPVIIRFGLEGVQDAEQALQRLSKSLADVERGGAAAAMKGADDRIKARKKEVDESIKLEEHFGKTKDKVAQDSFRSAQKALEQETREAEREFTKRERDAERAAERLNRIDEQAARKRANTMIREAERAHAEMEQMQRRYASHVGGAVSSSASRLMSGASMVMGAAAGIGGGFAIADVIRDRGAAEKQAALLVNTVTTGNTPPQGADVNSILDAASSTAIATGMSKSDVVSGALEYSRKAKGGDFQGAMANMGFFAKMSAATGASVTDIASAAGTLQSQNTDLSSGEMQQMLLNVYAQGKQGSMSMVDVAKQMGTLASTRSSFAGDVSKNQMTLMALGQLAAPEGSIEEAGIGVKNLALEAGKHSDELRAMHVKFNSRGQMESPEQLIEQVFRGTGGDMTKIEKIFGARGSKVFQALSGTFNNAGGGEAGIEAIHGAMANVSGATMTAEQLDKQVTQMMSTPSERIARSFAMVREDLESKLAPALEHFAVETLPRMLPYIERAINVFDSLASALADNPIKGLGLIIGGFMLKELAAAHVGFVIKEVVMQSISGAGIGPALLAVTSAPLAAAVTGIIGALAALGLAIGGYMAIKEANKQDVDSQNKGAGRMAEAESLVGKARAGKATPEDMRRLKELRGQIEQDQIYFTDQAAPGVVGKIVGSGALGSDAKDAATARQHVMKEQADRDAMLRQAITQALEPHTKALIENTAATNANTKGTGTIGPGRPANPMTGGSISDRTPTPPQGPGK